MKTLADNGLVKLLENHHLEIAQDANALGTRGHDIAGAIAGLRFIVKAVKSRYEFTVEESNALGESAEKALETLETEARFMLAVYESLEKESLKEDGE